MGNVNLIDQTSVTGNPVDKMSMFNRPDSWLLHLGHLTEISEQNLILYGHIACPGVITVECSIDAPNYKANYLVVLNKRAMMWYKLQKWLSAKRKLWTSLILFLILKFVGPFNPEIRINRCIQDYAGERWKTNVEVLSVGEYTQNSNGSRAKAWFLTEGNDNHPEIR